MCFISKEEKYSYFIKHYQNFSIYSQYCYIPCALYIYLFLKSYIQSPKTSATASDYCRPIHLFLLYLLTDHEFRLKYKKKKNPRSFPISVLGTSWVINKCLLTSWFSKQSGINYSERNLTSPPPESIIHHCYFLMFKIFFFYIDKSNSNNTHPFLP